MGNCVCHEGRAGVGTCRVCGREYCMDCMLLNGRVEAPVCRGCFGALEKQVKAMTRRRIAYIVLCMALVALAVLYLLFADAGNMLVPILLVIAVLLAAAAVHAARMWRVRDALVVKPWPAPSPGRKAPPDKR